MALTTVIVDLRTAHGVVPPDNISYIRARVPVRRVSGTSVIVPGARPVPLVGGKAVLNLEPGIWIFDEVVPNYTREIALRVPASAVPVEYNTLEEQRNPELEDGYAPQYVYRAQAAAFAAELAETNSEAAQAGAVRARDIAIAEAERAQAPRVEAYYDPMNPAVVIFTPSAAVRPDPLNPEILEIAIIQ
jgi:hypothetical protein